MSKMYRYTDFVGAKYEEDFIIYGLSRGEIGVLYGPGAVGKGFFIKSIMRDSNNFLNNFEGAKKRRILFVSIEDQLEVTHNKFHEMEICHEDVHFVFADDPNESWENFDLVIIDTWSRYCRGRWDENSNKEMGQAYEDIVARAQKHQVAVLIVSHVTKASREQEASINSLRGAGTLSDNARLAISLERSGDVVLAKIQKCNRAHNKSQEFQVNHDGELKPLGGFTLTAIGSVE